MTVGGEVYLFVAVRSKLNCKTTTNKDLFLEST
jgi:hypothetical protein